MPLLPRLVLGCLLVLAGLALLTVAVLGARGVLRRNRFAGVRTAATLRSDAAFTLAHRVAAPLLGAAGAVGAAGGGVLLAGAPTGVVVVVLVVTVLGVLVLAGTAGVLGDRAASAAPADPAPGCGGPCAGCDLVAGCSGASSSD